jgi:hypothetical protein
MVGHPALSMQSLQLDIQALNRGLQGSHTIYVDAEVMPVARRVATHSAVLVAACNTAKYVTSAAACTPTRGPTP